MPVPDNVAQLNPYGPLITFQSQNILPPSAIYVGPNDSIFLQVFCPTISTTVNLYWRFLRPDGTLMVNSDAFNVTPTGGGVFTTSIPPSEGFLLSMVASGLAMSRGQCFIRAFLNPGGLQSAPLFPHLFLQGYVSVVDAVAFPQSPLESSLTGRGWLRDLSGPGGAGIVPVIAVPAGVHWLLRAARYNVTTDAVVGNRFAALSIIDPTATRTFVQWAPAAIPATTAMIFNFAPGAQATSNVSEQTAGAPADLIVPAGWSIAGRMFNQDPGDVTGNIFVTVEEFVGQ